MKISDQPQEVNTALTSNGASEFKMDIKLANYRAEKRRKYRVENAKRSILSFLTFGFRGRGDNTSKEKCDTDMMVTSKDDESSSPSTSASLVAYRQQESEDEYEEDEASDPAEVPIDRRSIMKWILYISLWGVLFLIFLELQFGAVYFTASLLVVICLNTRTRKKKRGEISAYSVFNANCQSIDGTLKAEDLERQFLFGGIGIR